jgi:hypothetical protein
VCRIFAFDGERREIFDGPMVAERTAPARRASFDALDRAARESGGLSAPAGGEEPLIQSLLEPSAPAVPVERHPMRSPWWILPFAACLGVEWWDRRRRGLR